MYKGSSLLAFLFVLLSTNLIAAERYEATRQLKQVVYSGDAAQEEQYLIQYKNTDGTYSAATDNYAVIPIPEIVLANMPTITAWHFSSGVVGNSFFSGLAFDSWYPLDVTVTNGYCLIWWKHVLPTSVPLIYTRQFKIVVTYEDSPAIAATPFRIISTVTTNETFSLKWQTTAGQKYGLDASTNLTFWTPLAGSLTATGADYTFSTNTTNSQQFFRVFRTP